MMKGFFPFIIILTIFACFSCSGHEPAHPRATEVEVIKQADIADPAEFTLGPGDEVVVSVWRNNELGRTVTIDPAGKIRLPLAGEIMASGLTVSQLNNEISTRLKEYITDPFVDVNIVSISSRKIHVLGEVRSPGTFTYDRQIPVWEAVSKAGGFTDDANKLKLLLVKVANEEARISVLSMDFEQMLENGTIKGDYYLKDGDILYIPETEIASVEKFMIRLNNIINPIYTIERMITLSPNFVDALQGKSTRVISN